MNEQRAKSVLRRCITYGAKDERESAEYAINALNNLSTLRGVIQKTRDNGMAYIDLVTLEMIINNGESK